MEYKTFEKIKEEKISTIGMGCWAIGAGKDWPDSKNEDSIKAISMALDYDINFFDTAPVYGLGHSEEVLGKALKGKRHKAFIASKFGLPWDDNKNVRNDLSKKSMLKEIDDSLTRLQTDYIDLWQAHWPDDTTDLDETIAAMIQIRDSGKVKYIGLSNFSLSDTQKIEANVGIVSYQGLYNIIERNPNSYHSISLTYKTEDEILPFMDSIGGFFLPYSPLMQGLLVKNIHEIKNFKVKGARANNPELKGEALEKNIQKIIKLNEVANEAGLSMLELVISWLKSQKAMGSIISGIYKEQQLESILKMKATKLSADIIKAIDDITLIGE